MNNILQKLIGKSNAQIVYLGMVNAKAVTISKPHDCSECGKHFEEYSVMCTASRYIDKGKNKTLTEILDNEENPKDYKFVLQRHWVCKDCLEKLVNKQLKKKSKPKKQQVEHRYPSIYSEEFAELPLEEQLEAYEQAYEAGELSAEEYDDIENTIIHDIAFRDALGIGQE